MLSAYLCDELFDTKVSHKPSKAYHMLSVSSFQLTRVGQRFFNFVPAFQKLSKGETEIVQACDRCHVPGFCAFLLLFWEWGYLILW